MAQTPRAEAPAPHPLGNAPGNLVGALEPGGALLFAIGTGLACGIMLCLVRGFGALAITQPSAMQPALSPGRASASRGAGVFYTLVPALGYFAVGHAGRGKLFLLAALAAGLSGLVITIAALTLLVKGGVLALPLLSGGRGARPPSARTRWALAPGPVVSL